MKTKDIKKGKDYAVIQSMYRSRFMNYPKPDGIDPRFKPYAKHMRVTEIKEVPRTRYNHALGTTETYFVKEIHVADVDSNSKITKKEWRPTVTPSNVIAEWSVYKDQLDAYEAAVKKEKELTNKKRNKAIRENQKRVREIKALIRPALGSKDLDKHVSYSIPSANMIGRGGSQKIHLSVEAADALINAKKDTGPITLAVGSGEKKKVK